MMVAILPKHGEKLLTTFIIFSVLVVLQSRALSVVDNHASAKLARKLSSTRQEGNRNEFSRRDFLVVGVCSASSSTLLLTKPAGAADGIPKSDGDTRDALLCHPSKEQMERLSETRAQIDMAVQASSVQAFQSAFELVNDPLLDASALSSLLENLSCENNPSLSKRFAEKGIISEFLLTVAKMQETLGSGSSKLTTEDAMTVMRYGTSARSTLDSFFSLYPP